ncbi:helicase HerA-like domain-containing protein [Infirmifilum sp. SLHALR2]|nr:MAG: hypothetical protein B7L53_07980 [Thermofilum sp. NZ13]
MKSLKVNLSKYLPSVLRIPESHILIVGPTGSGKTNTAKVLVEEYFKKGVKVLILDWHGEYKGLKRYVPGENFSMNILERGETLKHDPEFVVDLFSQVFQLSEQQCYFLAFPCFFRVRPASSLASIGLEGGCGRVFEQPLEALSSLRSQHLRTLINSHTRLAVTVEVSAEVWASVARWLELTGLTKTLWRLRQTRPLSRAFGTRNTRYIASALEKLRSAGFVKEAVVGNVRYIYLTERACGLLVLLGYSVEEAACGESASGLLRRGGVSA